LLLDGGDDGFEKCAVKSMEEGFEDNDDDEVGEVLIEEVDDGRVGLFQG
jgi:hypothetical protein